MSTRNPISANFALHLRYALQSEILHDMTSIHSISSLRLDQPPSCIAFCPTQPQYFVIGTYLLHQNEASFALSGEDDGDDASATKAQTRSGSLILYELDGDEL